MNYAHTTIVFDGREQFLSNEELDRLCEWLDTVRYTSKPGQITFLGSDHKANAIMFRLKFGL